MEEKQTNMHIILIAIVGMVAVVGIVGIMITMTSQNRVGQAVKVATPRVNTLADAKNPTTDMWQSCCYKNYCSMPTECCPTEPGQGPCNGNIACDDFIVDCYNSGGRNVWV